VGVCAVVVAAGPTSARVTTCSAPPTWAGTGFQWDTGVPGQSISFQGAFNNNYGFWTLSADYAGQTFTWVASPPPAGYDPNTSAFFAATFVLGIPYVAGASSPIELTLTTDCGTITFSGDAGPPASDSPPPGDSPPSSPPPAPTPAPAPPPAPTPQTFSEQASIHHSVPTFSNYHNASGQGQSIPASQVVQVSCKILDGTIRSVNPDGYWYRIASSPWNDNYYAAANTFLNGDPPNGPYSHNTDFAVPDCAGAPTSPAQPPPLSSYANHVVQWNGDTKAQKTSWLVGPDLKRRWIPDIATYQCLTGNGLTAWTSPLSSSTLNQLPDLANVWARCSGSWAGYVVNKPASMTVRAEVVLPSVTCNTAGAIAMWAGFDGLLDSSDTVEQDGVSADCSGSGAKPQFYLWYELYKNRYSTFWREFTVPPPITMVPVGSDVNLKPGDDVTLTVTILKPHGVLGVAGRDSVQFSISAKNAAGKSIVSWTETHTEPLGFSPQYNSAECILETPTPQNGSPTAAPKFSTTRFVQCSAIDEANTSSSQLEVVDLVRNGHLLAQPGGTSGGDAFSVNWLASN
jgi:hypothetical protein